MVVFSRESIMTNLLPRCFGYCAVDQTRRRFCQRRWPRTPATPPIANRADRIFETLKKCRLNWGVSVLRRAVEKANHRHGWLAARRDRPRRRTTEQRYELAASHCPMPPVLPTERIAHLGTADCCIRPPGRNEMIAITPPKIFSPGGGPKRATPLTAPATSLTTKNRFTPNFRGWGLDENLKPKSPPYRGVDYRGSAARQNEVGSRLAHPPRRLHPALRSRCAPCSRSSLYDCAKKAYKLNSSQPADKVYPHEIDIQETHPKHRKLDSQATLSHRARGRAPDGLRAQVRPLRASRRDHDPGRLSPRSAGLGGVRPAMAADRAIRGPPARSPRQERHS